jgi:hypothetical protein
MQLLGSHFQPLETQFPCSASIPSQRETLLAINYLTASSTSRSHLFPATARRTEPVQPTWRPFSPPTPNFNSSSITVAPYWNLLITPYRHALTMTTTLWLMVSLQKLPPCSFAKAQSTRWPGAINTRFTPPSSMPLRTSLQHRLARS